MKMTIPNFTRPYNQSHLDELFFSRRPRYNVSKEFNTGVQLVREKHVTAQNKEIVVDEIYVECENFGITTCEWHICLLEIIMSLLL